MGSQVTLGTPIRKLPYRLISELAIILDTSDQNRNWEALIRVLPEDLYTARQVRLFGMLERQGKSPSFSLLTDLGHQLMTVRELVAYLERINHQEALELIKPHEPVNITMQPTSQVAQEGNRVVLECNATSFPPPEFEWYKNDTKVQSEVDNSLIFDPVHLVDEGEYKCKVISRMGHVFTTAVTLQIMPRRDAAVLFEPNLPVYEEGQCLVLSSGRTGPSYQWVKDGYDLLGENGQDLRFNAVRREDEGNYSCKIFGPTANIVTAMAKITVNPAVKRAEPSVKFALVIGNKHYNFCHSLIHPENDCYNLTDELTKADFKVISLINLNLAEMEACIDKFCQTIQMFPGSYSLFYFGGHGFEVAGKTYLVPCDAPKKWTTDYAICAEKVLTQMQSSKTMLDIFILDVCRLPIDMDGELSSKHLFDPIFKPGSQSLFAYATCPKSQALERRADNNGMYVKHLLDFLHFDEPINRVIELAHAAVHRETERYDVTCDMQPTLKSSLTKQFSLKDPERPDPIVKSDAVKYWLLYQALPNHQTLQFDHGITVEMTFHALFFNTANVVLYVKDFGKVKNVDATIFKPPEGVTVPEESMNIRRPIRPPEYIPRSLEFNEAEYLGSGSPYERWTKLDDLQRMPKLIVMMVQVEYETDDNKVHCAHKNIVFKREEFGVASKLFSTEL